MFILSFQGILLVIVSVFLKIIVKTTAGVTRSLEVNKFNPFMANVPILYPMLSGVVKLEQ